jgi:Na+/H+ antiporter NhaD/arsenite permease-like protein
VRFFILALFVLAYVGISARRLRLLPIGRPAMALVGASAIVVAGQLAGDWGLSADEALHAVEPHTIALLLGMMVIAAGLAEAGFFAWATSALARRVKTPAGLLWAVTVGAGLSSAFLVNDAVCLLATPLVLAVVARKGAPTTPFVFALAMGANAGSALTLSGNPQNMLVARLSGLGYREYLIDALVPAGGALVLTAAILHLVFRRELLRPDALAGAPSAPAAEPVALDRPLLVVGLAALAGVVVANVLGASLALTALAAASVVLLAARRRAEHLLTQVDWSVLLFFGGLFVLVAGLQKTGLPEEALAALGRPPEDGAGMTGSAALTLTLVLSIGSQIVSNVPLILLLEPWIGTFADPAEAWRITALVTTLAGNLTILGSVANIIVLERARVHVGFFAYMRIGVPVTVASTAFALAVRLLMA